MPDTEGFRWGLDVNLIGAVLGMKHGIAALRKRGGGSITTMSSNGGGFPRGGCAGDLGNLTFATPYCLTSAALDQLARVGTYYNTENIRCYGLKVGVYASEMVDGWVDHYKENIDEEANDDSIAGFNFFFSEMTGNPVHIGHIYEVRPYPNPSRLSHSHRPACNKVRLRRFPHRLASTPPSQPPTNTCT